MINSHHCYNSSCDDASYMWDDEQLTPDEWEARWKALHEQDESKTQDLAA